MRSRFNLGRCNSLPAPIPIPCRLDGLPSLMAMRQRTSMKWVLGASLSLVRLVWTVGFGLLLGLGSFSAAALALDPAVDPIAQAIPHSFVAEAARAVAPAVVRIDTEREVARQWPVAVAPPALEAALSRQSGASRGLRTPAASYSLLQVVPFRACTQHAAAIAPKSTRSTTTPTETSDVRVATRRASAW